MKKFQFRLEQVLQQKITREEQALLEQVKAQQECSRCEQELLTTKQKLEETLYYSQRVMEPGEQMQTLMYREHLLLTIDRQNRSLRRAQDIFRLRKDTAIAARQERMVLEKLKEKQFGEYKELEIYLEQKEIDELATLGYSRKGY
ncbi:flagellar export protein FliJ [Desulforamulus profundi]|uniref:Flagellar FliJ protein n=1 Tax=Desulforamulus profundi TaxID=1383067 RepID=A0A2C6MHS4_9FIRM|nr:flagellar FliJ family protein [Desulforamulus profundi]MCL5780228.1 flagellar FliJ family protein [Bacillota bacterium]PHJ39053.1 flagellar export protein FliJ [Desulforamulus profundi]